MDLVTAARFARKLVWKKNASPEYVLFQVTSRCNIKCSHCFLWAETGYGWENTNAGKFDLTLEEIRRISASMPEFYFMNMTGGEPFLRADVPEIIETFYRNNRLRALLIPTNGTVQERTLESVREILRRCPELTLAVDVSIDGLGELHDRIRGAPGGFEKTVETFRALRRLQPEQPRLQLGVIMSCMRSNQDSLEALYDFVRAELEPDSVSVALVRGSPLEPEEKRVDMEKYRAITDRLEADLLSGSLKGFRKQSLAPLTLAAKVSMHHQILETVRRGYQTRCYAAVLNAVIYSNGDLYPCEMLGPDRKIGNLREAGLDFAALWRSRKRRETADWVRDTKCHCTHECHIPVNLLFNPARLPSLLTMSLRFP